ncbi:hypothetical protein C5S32_06745 [ANME-1 cluster archaeon GoMg1]|jgi:hypothetical protein|nr:hypothetical protein [ANME-1 cluster archaeon GoMg1]
MGAVLVDNKAGILAEEKSVLDIFGNHIKFIIFEQV